MHTIGLATGSGATSVSLVTGRFVGLAGLEPAASSLSEMDGRALCYPAFALVVLLRKSYKDGVNRCPPPSVRRYVAGSGLGRPPGHRWPSICHGPGGQRMRSRSSSLRRPVSADRRRWRGSALASWRWAHASWAWSVIPSGVMVYSRTWGWWRLARVFSTVRVRRTSDWWRRS